MIWKILAIVFAVFAIILMAVLLKLRAQLHQVNEQLELINEHDTNMKVTTDMHVLGIGRLKRNINRFLQLGQERRRSALQKERMIADTYTNLSHDIRTPLTSLDGYFQLLREEEDPERQEHYIQIIQERIASLKDMLEELFLFTKVKNASFQLEGTVGCVNRILKQTVFSYYEEWKKMQIEPTVDLCPEPVYAIINEQALRRVFQNMIKNSIVHGKRNIHVRMYTGDVAEVPAVYVSISNDVEHPEAIDPQKVFERFYKADEARSVASSGLGLAIAKELVERMGGGIEAKIEKRRFAVILWLPVAEAPAQGKSANHPMFAPN